MCDPVTATVAVVGAATAMSSKPKMPAMPDPVQPAQQAKRPTDQRTGPRAGTQQGGMPAPQSTLLTGPGGVDPGMLQLGKSTLLGQ